MHKFEYIHRILKSEEVEEFVNKHGADGWRLHSLEVTYMVPENPPEGKKPVNPGGAFVYLAVVLEKATYEEKSERNHSTGDGAMAMKG